MKTIVLILLSLLVIITSKSVFAANSCSQVFSEKKQVDHSVELAVDRVIEQAKALISQFEAVKGDMINATLKSEMNDHTYSLVIISNRMLDLSIEHIVDINLMPMPEVLKNTKSKVVEVIIEQLQLSFQLENEHIQPVVMERVEAIIEEIKTNYLKATERKAAGFHRDELAIDFQVDPEKTTSVGFLKFNQDRDTDENSEVVTIGFHPESHKNLQQRVSKLVEYEGPEMQVDPVPVGFVTFSHEAETGDSNQSIGFLPAPADKDVPTADNTHKILFDLESGEFLLFKK